MKHPEEKTDREALELLLAEASTTVRTLTKQSQIIVSSLIIVTILLGSVFFQRKPMGVTTMPIKRIGIDPFDFYYTADMRYLDQIGVVAKSSANQVEDLRKLERSGKLDGITKKEVQRMTSELMSSNAIAFQLQNLSRQDIRLACENLFRQEPQLRATAIYYLITDEVDRRKIALNLIFVCKGFFSYSPESKYGPGYYATLTVLDSFPESDLKEFGEDIRSIAAVFADLENETVSDLARFFPTLAAYIK